MQHCASLRGADATDDSEPIFKKLDCFAAPVIGPAISGRTAWLAMPPGRALERNRFRLNRLAL
jgi:hypothetical protein